MLYADRSGGGGGSRVGYQKVYRSFLHLEAWLLVYLRRVIAMNCSKTDI
jgi:hypothetical protein